jgi:predicted nucleic acid-binding protein
LGAALQGGPLVINDIIAAELAPVFDDEDALWTTLSKAQVRLDPYPREAIFVAGRALLRYRRAGGKRQRILPDFMIAAHAIVRGAALLTRDRGFYRAQFPSLELAV